MKKNFAVISAVLVLAVALIFSGCAKNKNDKITVATIDGQEITKTEYLAEWKILLSNNGKTESDLKNQMSAEELETEKKLLLEEIVQKKVITEELDAMGYLQLTQEEDQSIKDQVQAVLDNALSTKLNEMYAEIGEDYTEAQYVRAANKYTNLALEEYGLTKEYINDLFKYYLVENKARAELVDLSFTDEEVKTLFDEKVAQDKEAFSDLQVYEYITTQQGYVPYYIPEGLRKVRHVLIAFDDETINKIRNLRESGDDDAADKIRTTAHEKIVDKANSVLTKLNEGSISFDDAITQFNDDPGMQAYPDGYEMSLESMGYVQEFTDAGMALKNIGDISGLVATDFGYHIMEYYMDVESGPISFDEVKSSLSDELTQIKSTDGWNALVEEWLAKHEIEYFYENIYEEQAADEAQDTQN